MFGNLESDLKALAESDVDTKEGLFALFEFHMAANAQAGSQVPGDFNTFLEGLRDALYPVDLDHAWPGFNRSIFWSNPDRVFKTFVSGLGLQVNVAGSSWTGAPEPLDHSKVASAMASLAIQGQGRIPTDPNAFTQALMGEATDVQFLDAVWYTAAKSTEQVAEAAVEVGEAVIETAGSVLQYKNYIMIAVALLAGFILYKKYGDKPEGVKANPSKKKFKKSTEVQTLLIPISKFPSKKEARTWAKKHGFKFGFVDSGNAMWRIRQKHPRHFMKKTFRTITMGKHVKAVVGVPKK